MVGRVGNLRNALPHHSVESLDRYLSKHNEYSNWEARVLSQATEPSDELAPAQFGRLDPKKGIESLLKACSLIDSALPWRLAIAGWGPTEYVSHLKEQIPGPRLGGRVEILGPVLSEAKKGLFELF
jgi:glycosyltransferase involved in cell wall biosynthesis